MYVYCIFMGVYCIIRAYSTACLSGEASMVTLGQRLKELVKEYRIERVEDFCKSLGLGRTDFYRWWCDTTMPSVSSAIKLADSFYCSLDYLAGRTDSNYDVFFNDPADFGVRIKELMKQYNTNPHRLSVEAGISRASIYEWMNNRAEITLDSLIKIADLFGCSVDYLIGRTDS